MTSAHTQPLNTIAYSMSGIKVYSCASVQLHIYTTDFFFFSTICFHFCLNTECLGDQRPVAVLRGLLFWK